MRILVIALSGIGDALLFTPAARLIRTRFPDSTLDALVMFKGAQAVYERSGLFNSVVYHDFLGRSWYSSLEVVFGLRRKYDYSLNVYPSNRKEYNVIQYLIGAKRRGAVKYLRRDFSGFGFLGNRRIHEDDTLHCVEENAAMCGKLLDFDAGEIPDMLLPLTPADIAYSESYIRSKGIAAKDLVIGFHAGTATFKNQAKRRWEPEKFAALARRLVSERSAKVLVFGGPDELGLKSEIVSNAGSAGIFQVDAPGIPEAAAIMRRCDVFVTNDSGLMHVAAAMKRKIVAIIGPTSTAYIHPWHTEYKIASLNLECSPCFIYSPRPLKCFRGDVKFKCIKELQVEAVYNKIASLIG